MNFLKLAALWLIAAVSYAEPLTIIVQTPLGSGMDQQARYFASQLEKELKAPVVVKSMVGADGLIALRATHGTPNTLFIANVNQSEQLNNKDIAPLIEDLTPLQVTFEFDGFVVVPAQSPVRTISDLKKLSDKRKLLAAGTGFFSTKYSEQLDASTGTSTEVVHYRDRAQMLIDVLNNLVDYTVYTTVTPQLAPMVAEGKLRIIAATGPVRSSYFPDAPSLKELGYTPVDLYVWYAYMAPSAMPPAYRAEIKAALNTIFQSKETDAWVTEHRFRKSIMTADDVWPRMRREQKIFAK